MQWVHRVRQGRRSRGRQNFCLPAGTGSGIRARAGAGGRTGGGATPPEGVPRRDSHRHRPHLLQRRPPHRPEGDVPRPPRRPDRPRHRPRPQDRQAAEGEPQEHRGDGRRGGERRRPGGGRHLARRGGGGRRGGPRRLRRRGLLTPASPCKARGDGHIVVARASCRAEQHQEGLRAMRRSRPRTGGAQRGARGRGGAWFAHRARELGADPDHGRGAPGVRGAHQRAGRAPVEGRAGGGALRVPRALPARGGDAGGVRLRGGGRPVLRA
mmetsp:Transcript_27373/g.59813  ORF Transcript_27373/g.59813 Transcript_27373/m.59813 type:complete len:268 (+) Transcript_27373:436-1239(+)